MLTAKSIQQLGYTQKESYNIMQKMKVKGCTVTSIRIAGNYVRNGVICHYLQYCDAIDVKEGLEALRAYLERLPILANRSKWEDVLNELKTLDIGK